MPHFSLDDVNRLARLARLSLSSEEVNLFATQLSDILEFARQVQSVDTTGVTLDGADAGTVPLRPDTVTPSLSRDEALAESAGADSKSGLFTVPRVISG